MKKLLGVFLTFLFVTSLVFAVDFPQYQNFVSDYTGTLSLETQQKLNEKLKNYEVETGSEIAVVLINSTEGMPISQYATALGNKWGVGKKEVDNGAILVVAKDDRKLFIATGSQMEGALTDIESKDIIDNIITPHFKAGNFDLGIEQGIDGIIKAIKGESFTDLRMSTDKNFSGMTVVNKIINFILFFFIFGLQFFAAFFGKSKRIWPGGLFGLLSGIVISLMLFTTITTLSAIFTILGISLFGLFLDWFFSRSYRKSQETGETPWWIGGSGGSSGSSSSGGFGGFSGGGFSGGGAGGDW